MQEMMIRISQGVGSNPKLWAVSSGKNATQVGEFDLSDAPGWYSLDEDGAVTGINGMSGIVWKHGMIAETYPRKLYRSVDEWAADIAAEYPDAEIIRADNEPQHWL